MPAPRTMTFASMTYDDRQAIETEIRSLRMHPEVADVSEEWREEAGQDVRCRIRVVFASTGPLIDPELTRRMSRYDEQEVLTAQGRTDLTVEEATYMVRREMAEQMVAMAVEALLPLTPEAVDQILNAARHRIRIRQAQRFTPQPAVREMMSERAAQGAAWAFDPGTLTFTGAEPEESPVVAEIERADNPIASFLATDEGRARLASSLTAPLRRNLDYQGVARRMFAVEPMPGGAVDLYAQIGIGGDMVGDYPSPEVGAQDEGWIQFLVELVPGRWVVHSTGQRAEILTRSLATATAQERPNGKHYLLSRRNYREWSIEGPSAPAPTAYDHLLDD